MVKLPDTGQIRKRIPNYTSAVQNIPVSQEGNSLIEGGRSLGRTAQRLNNQANLRQRQEDIEDQKEQQRQQEKQKFEITRAKSYIDAHNANLLDDLSQDEDYGTLDEKYNKGFNDIKGKALSLPSIANDPLAKGYLELYANKKRNAGLLKNKQIVRTKQNDRIKASLLDVSNNYQNLYATSDVSEVQAIEQNFNTMLISAVKSGAITATEAVKERNNFMVTAQRNRLNSLPPEQALQEITGNPIGKSFDKVIPDILKIEGGYVADDAGAGPTNFGINQSANPDVDVKNLTKEQATEIYKKRYWDKINADALPANMQYIAMDSAVNQGVSWTKKAIEKSGGDVDEFYKLRKERYLTTASISDKAQYKDTWLKRLDKAYDKSKKVKTDYANTVGALPTSEVLKTAQKRKKELDEIQEKSVIESVSSVALTQYPNDYEKQVSLVNSLNIDSEARKKTMSILNAKQKEREVIKKENIRENTFKVLNVIDQGGSINDVPADIMIELSAKDRSFLQNYYDKKNFTEAKKEIQKKQEIVNERLLFSQVQDAYYEGGIEALKEFDVAKLASNLSDGHFNKYRSWLEPKEAAKPDSVKANRQQINATYRDTVAILGIGNDNEDDIARQSMLREALEQDIEQFTLTNQRPPKYSEVLEIKNSLIRNVTTDKGWFGDTQKRVFELSPEDDVVSVPDDAKELIMRGLQSRNPNKSYSEADILKIYRSAIK